MKPLFTYLKESRAEIAKVVWPSRNQAIRLTVAVVIFSLALAAIIGILDYGYVQIMQKVIFKV